MQGESTYYSVLKQRVWFLSWRTTQMSQWLCMVLQVVHCTKSSDSWHRSSCDRMACKALNIYNQALHRKRLQSPGREGAVWPQKEIWVAEKRMVGPSLCIVAAPPRAARHERRSWMDGAESWEQVGGTARRMVIIGDEQLGALSLSSGCGWKGATC